MKTKRSPKAAKAAAPVNPVTPVNEVAPPAPAPELDIEPWKVITIQSKPKHVLGKAVITITSKLQYRGRTVATSTGAKSAEPLQALANQYNATNKVPRFHKKAYADLGEASRAATAMKLCNQGNIMQPFEP